MLFHMANTSKGNGKKLAVGAAAAGLAVGTALGVFAKSDKAKKMKADAELKLAETKIKAKEKGEELKQKAEKVQKELKKDMKEAKKDAKDKMDA
jgi:uncharacterized protein HemX